MVKMWAYSIFSRFIILKEHEGKEELLPHKQIVFIYFLKDV